MAKSKTRWVCQECGFSASKFLGKCTDCGTWSSMVEEMEVDQASIPLRARGSTTVTGSSSCGPQPLSEVETSDSLRFPTGLASVDEVLGGGLVAGSVILLAGDPGVGKSTFLLQIADVLSKRYKVLYISGEESKQQVRLRSQRLGMMASDMLIDSEQNAAQIIQRMDNTDADFVFVDSVQAIFHPEVSSAPGSVSQVRECAGSLVTCAKSRDICTILVGHVTKDGTIAGPRVLEHMVDVVLHFEGDKARQLRVLRAIKNRFGSTQEISIFTMNETGLQEVDNASALFLGDRLSKTSGERAPSGTAVLAACEGNRSMLLEVQALVGSSSAQNPRRVANGCDFNRVLQIIAVLDKRVGLSLSHQEIYVNIVGGFEVADPAGDLGIAMAIATSYLDRSIDPLLICIGEIGLSGEIRPVANVERRLRESAQMGFRKALVPQANLPVSGKFDQLEIVGVEYLIDALKAVMPGVELGRRSARSSADTKDSQVQKRGTKRQSQPLELDDPELIQLLK